MFNVTRSQRNYNRSDEEAASPLRPLGRRREAGPSWQEAAVSGPAAPLLGMYPEETLGRFQERTISPARHSTP